MTDFLLELLSEEIPARMQGKASEHLANFFEERLRKFSLDWSGMETYVTPRRLTLIVRGLADSTTPKVEERKGPRADAPDAAVEGFLRSSGLTRDLLEVREDKKGNKVLFGVIRIPGLRATDVLKSISVQAIREFPWPKSMRWGAASVSTESPRWVRPLQGIVALFGEEIVDFEIAGIRSGAATVGHRFHHPGTITLGGANDYAERLQACHVIVDPAERRRLIAEGAAAAARKAGLVLVEDEGLLAENAGLTEWPVPLLGRFDPAFLDVPPEVIQLTMRTNQKYFAVRNGEGALAPAFVCTANIEAADGGAAIVAGNEKVLAARLSDAKFFWEQDLKIPLEAQAEKLSQIVFHEKLGTVADKVERVAKLARWLVEEGIVGGSEATQKSVRPERSRGALAPTPHARPSTSLGTNESSVSLAALAERAARLAKADLVTGMVGEFPELQGVIGGYLARAQSEPDAVADAIRDHYKPVGQGDEVPTAPVTVAVSLADKLDTLFGFFAWDLTPTGSKDPYALRRAALAVSALAIENSLRFSLSEAASVGGWRFIYWRVFEDHSFQQAFLKHYFTEEQLEDDNFSEWFEKSENGLWSYAKTDSERLGAKLFEFLTDRLKVQQREAGVRHDLIDAVFALGGEDDLIRLLARVRALQAFVETPEGADLLAGYKRAANILKKENWEGASRALSTAGSDTIPQTGEEDPLVLVDDPQLADAVAAFEARHPEQDANKSLSYTPEKEEEALIAALDSAEPRARAAVEAEDFEGAMAALASLRGPVDAFFEKVTVNDPVAEKREARLDLLARMRDAVHAVADFSRIEG